MTSSAKYAGGSPASPVTRWADVLVTCVLKGTWTKICPAHPLTSHRLSRASSSSLCNIYLTWNNIKMKILYCTWVSGSAPAAVVVPLSRALSSVLVVFPLFSPLAPSDVRHLNDIRAVHPLISARGPRRSPLAVRKLQLSGGTTPHFFFSSRARFVVPRPSLARRRFDRRLDGISSLRGGSLRCCSSGGSRLDGSAGPRRWRRLDSRMRAAWAQTRRRAALG